MKSAFYIISILLSIIAVENASVSALPQIINSVELVKRNALLIGAMAAEQGEKELGAFTRLISGSAAKQAHLDVERSETELQNFAADSDKYQEDTNFQLNDANRNTGLAYDQYRYQVDQDALDASRNSDLNLFRDFLNNSQENSQDQVTNAQDQPSESTIEPPHGHEARQHLQNTKRQQDDDQNESQEYQGDFMGGYGE